jgi:hypothetical protein
LNQNPKGVTLELIYLTILVCNFGGQCPVSF